MLLLLVVLLISVLVLLLVAFAVVRLVLRQRRVQAEKAPEALGDVPEFDGTELDETGNSKGDV